MKIHPLLEEVRGQVGNASKSEFMEKFKEHFLVVEMKVYDKASQQLFTRGPSQVTLEPARTDNSMIVAVLGKTNRNKDADRITIGRAPDNDVIIFHPSISKLHAFMKYSGTSESVKVSDAGSRFGTCLNGIPVGMGANMLMQSGDTLVFARSVTASYFTPQDFYEYLKITRDIY